MPRTPALFSPCTRGGHRVGEWPCGVFYRRPADRRRGGSCNLHNRALQSESNHRGIKRPTFYPSTTSAAIQCRRGISPRRPYDPRRFLPSATPRPVGGGPSRGANKKQAKIADQYYKLRTQFGRIYRIPPCVRGDPREPIGGPQGSHLRGLAQLPRGGSQLR